MASYFKKQWAMYRYDRYYRNKVDPENGAPLTESMAHKLIDPYSDPPPALCHVLYVPGTGEISMEVGRETADLIGRRGVLRPGGTVFCTGGIGVAWKNKKNGLGLLEELAAANDGLILPNDDTVEAESTADNIMAALEDYNDDPERYNFKVKGGKKTDAQGNVDDAVDLGLLNFEALGVEPGEDMVMGVVATPQTVMRYMGTVRGRLDEKGYGDANKRIALRPLPAWPRGLGIEEDNYLDDWRGRAFTNIEVGLSLLPEPCRAPYAKYMAKDFAYAASQMHEKVKLFDALKKQDRGAASQWLRRQAEEMRMPHADLIEFKL